VKVDQFSSKKQQMAQDNKIIFFFFFFFFTSLLCKTLMMFLLRKHCKEGASVVTHFEEIQKCKRLKFDSESPVDEENSI